MDAFLKVVDAHVTCEHEAVVCSLCVQYGKKIPIEPAEMQIAGSAPNVAVGARRLGLRSAVISAMGQDETYKQARRFLRSEGVSTRYIQPVPGARSSFSAVINYHGESTQLVGHAHIPLKFPKRLPTAAWLHVSEIGEQYQDAFEHTLNWRKAQDFQISFNPGAVQIKDNAIIFREMLAKSDVLIVNAVEAQTILEQDGTPSTLLPILQQVNSRIAIITDGKNGAFASDGTNSYFAPMFPGERVEATGAGDAFATGVLGALAKHLSLAEALAWGAVNSASVVQYVGPTTGLLTQSQITEFLRQNPDYQVKGI